MAAKEQAELTIQLQREEFRKKEAASEMKRKTFEDARALERENTRIRAEQKKQNL